mmetsp:Transcript_17869/g.53058  ORF Transcript_17869/g.53058 Transcript_17869/m.53058 type:complete len:209 (-) Transcript_17869:236-862(-)
MHETPTRRAPTASRPTWRRGWRPSSRFIGTSSEGFTDLVMPSCQFTKVTSTLRRPTDTTLTMTLSSAFNVQRSPRWSRPRMRGPSGSTSSSSSLESSWPQRKTSTKSAAFQPCSLAASTALSGDGVSRGESESAAATFSWMLIRSLRWKRRTMSFARLRCFDSDDKVSSSARRADSNRIVPLLPASASAPSRYFVSCTVDRTKSWCCE